MWKTLKYLDVSNTFLNKPVIKEDIKMEISMYFELNENKSTAYKKMWDAAKKVTRRKFIVSILENERHQVNDLSFQFKN